MSKTTSDMITKPRCLKDLNQLRGAILRSYLVKSDEYHEKYHGLHAEYDVELEEELCSSAFMSIVNCLGMHAMDPADERYTEAFEIFFSIVKLGLQAMYDYSTDVDDLIEANQ